MTTESKTSWRANVFAALALAFASFGDAFLYPFLPVNYDIAGIPVVWVGVLLSINRFVRIFSNGLMVRAFSKFGLRLVMLLSVVLAILSTAGYAIATGILYWVILRVLWGISFSAMRIGTLAYALQQPRMGFSLGLSRSLQEMGPTACLFFTPLVLKYIPSDHVFHLLALLSMPALWFVWKLPKTNDKTDSNISPVHFRFPSGINTITLVSSILIDGVLVIVLGVMFLQHSEDISLWMATSLAAFYLGYRRVCLVLLSAGGGWIADRVGLDKVFSIATMMVVVGLVFFISGWVATGCIIVFTFYAIQAAITPGMATTRQEHTLLAVAENATWRDIGAAAGTLAGGFLLASDYIQLTLFIGVLMLVSVLFFNMARQEKYFRISHLWK